MTASKHFYLYSIFVTITIIVGVIITEGNPLEIEVSFWQYISFGCLKALGMLLAVAIIFSWINNLFLLSYFYKRKYRFISINLFPFALQKEADGNKIKIWLSINSLVQWHTIVSYKSIDNNIACEQYIRDWQDFLRKLVLVHRVLLLGLMTTIIFSVQLSIFLCVAWLALQSLYTMPGTDIMQEGLLVWGKKQENTYCLFMNIDLEECDKKLLYSLVQKQYFQKAPITINEKLFINQILVDSIYDEKNYLSSDIEKYLEERYLFRNDNQLREFAIVNARTLFLYYLYLIKIKNADFALKNIIAGNLDVLESYYQRIPHYGKLFRKSMQKEKYNPKYRFPCYLQKINIVYRTDIFENYEHL